MNHFVLFAVVGLAALACFSTAQQLPSLRRDVRKSKHSDRESKDTPPEEALQYSNEGYTVVTIPKSASKPTIVDSLMSMINNATKATTATPAPETEATSATPPESVQETATTSAPIAANEAIISTEKPSGDGLKSQDSNKNNPEVKTTESIVDTSPTSPPHSNDLNSSALPHQNSSVPTDNKTPTIASVCEESKQQMIDMFKKVIGQLGSLFDSLYEKMSAIAQPKTPAASN